MLSYRLMEFEFKKVFAEYMVISLQKQEAVPILPYMNIDEKMQVMFPYLHKHWEKARQDVKNYDVFETFIQKCRAYDLPLDQLPLSPALEKVDSDWFYEVRFLVADFFLTKQVDQCDA